jgi:hypothetical protein
VTGPNRLYLRIQRPTEPELKRAQLSIKSVRAPRAIKPPPLLARRMNIPAQLFFPAMLSTETATR